RLVLKTSAGNFQETLGVKVRAWLSLNWDDSAFFQSFDSGFARQCHEVAIPRIRASNQGAIMYSIDPRLDLSVIGSGEASSKVLMVFDGELPGAPPLDSGRLANAS